MTTTAAATHRPKPPSLLLLTLLLLPLLPPTTATHHHHQCSRSPHHNKHPCYRRWCHNTTNPSLCISTVDADRRGCWKTSPLGVTLIHVSAAKRNMRRTTSFIKKHLKSAGADAAAQQGLRQCLAGYRTVGEALDVSQCQLSDPETRQKIASSLDEVNDEVHYDCEWFQPDPFPAVLGEMFQKVNNFSAILQNAVGMIKLID